MEELGDMQADSNQVGTGELEKNRVAGRSF